MVSSDKLNYHSGLITRYASVSLLAGICPPESTESHLHILPEGLGCLWLNLYMVQVQHALISTSFPPILMSGEKKMLLFSALGGKVKQIIVLGSAAMILVGRRRE